MSIFVEFVARQRAPGARFQRQADVLWWRQVQELAEDLER